jgi:hypothetical protein
MTEYIVWVGGKHPWDSCYQSEVGGVKLTLEQKAKYFEEDEDGFIIFNADVISEQTDWRNEGAELPTWDTITDGSIGWGAYTDQLLGVCKTDDEDNPIYLRDVRDCPIRTYAEPRIENEDDVYIFYNSNEKGNFLGTFELPDGEVFDSKKLIVETTLVIDEFEIVTDVIYAGQALCMSGDTVGKGVDWYVYYKGNATSFK